MKNFRLKNLMMIAVTLSLFAACDKDDDNDTTKLEAVTVLVDATSYDDWVYYSFSESAEIVVTDPATDMSWDIALRRNHFRTNSGSSGNGSGGALDAGVVDFDTYVLAPETGYVVDDSIQSFDFATMAYLSVAANTVLETWGTFTEETPPLLEPSNKVFALKAATGNYAKILVQSYYGTEGSGYITFKYVYQPDGSTKLE